MTKEVWKKSYGDGELTDDYVLWVNGKPTNIVISGWTSLVVSLWFLGGIQMFFMGIIGEYIGKIYLETKERPRYIIKDILK